MVVQIDIQQANQRNQFHVFSPGYGDWSRGYQVNISLYYTPFVHTYHMYANIYTFTSYLIYEDMAHT